jgi:ABC-type glycerol-3-phosphate transport system substrate-binding protein
VKRLTMRSVACTFLLLGALMVVLAGCSGTATGSSPPTTSLNQPRPAEVIVHLKAGTSSSAASNLSKRLVNQQGDITGTDWNYQAPGVVLVYLGPSETVAEIDRLLPAIRKMSHVEGATVQFG